MTFVFEGENEDVVVPAEEKEEEATEEAAPATE